MLTALYKDKKEQLTGKWQNEGLIFDPIIIFITKMEYTWVVREKLDLLCICRFGFNTKFNQLQSTDIIGLNTDLG